MYYSNPMIVVTEWLLQVGRSGWS